MKDSVSKNKTNNMKKINLNLHIYVFIFVAMVTIINDNVIYFTKLNYNISLLISFILILLINIYCYKKKVFEIRTDFNKLDLIAIIPYSIIYFIIMLHIDDFIDTISYHLYNQRNPFMDRVNFDLFPSSSFFFPLGDRMNYIFVNFLGYRFGAILYWYVSIVIFYQIKNFLNYIIPEMKDKAKIIIATMILCTFSVNLCFGEYSIDIYSTVILLELLYIAIRNINIFEFKNYLYLSIFLAGVATGIKISNIVFVGIILLYISISSFKKLKNIKVYDVLICIIVFFIPIGVYMINNYVQTQSPIFPFYNSIFKSRYYEEVSAKDTRLGARNIIESILWPLIITIIPIRGDDIRGIVDPIWAVGYILSIYCLFKEKKNEKVFRLATLNTIITIVWIVFVCGYVRYGMFIAISYFFIEVYLLYKIIVELVTIKDNYNILSLIFKFIVIIMILFQILISVSFGAVYIIEKLKVSINDLSYITKEDTISKEYDIDGVWIASRYNIACIDLIRHENDPMYNADIIAEKDPMNVKSSYSNVSKQMFLEKIRRKKTIYSYK